MCAAALRVLFADSDLDYATSATRWFSERGHRAQPAHSFGETVMLLKRADFNILVADLDLPGGSWVDLLREARHDGRHTAVLFLAGRGSITGAVQAMRLGAFDYIPKPCELEDLERRCLDSLSFATHGGGGLAKKNDAGEHGTEIVGRSQVMLSLCRLIRRVGPSDVPVLIEGESGTGKELVARELQRCSSRKDRPFVIVNGASLPEPLMESEFFGHEKGAFTGAVGSKEGLLGSADGGTLFIDEIGELPLPLQAKLLRALENGTYRPVGSVKERRADVRLIAATNRNLSTEVAAGRFREDLYYRLNVITLHIPPLRDRPGDVRRLVSAFLGEDWRLDADTLETIERYRWPGNVRQLKNVVTRAKVIANRGVVRLCDLPTEIAFAAPVEPPAATHDDIESRQREHVLKILSRERGNKSRTARILGVNRRSLYRMLERYAQNGCAD